MLRVLPHNGGYFLTLGESYGDSQQIAKLIETCTGSKCVRSSFGSISQEIYALPLLPEAQAKSKHDWFYLERDNLTIQFKDSHHSGYFDHRRQGVCSDKDHAILKYLLVGILEGMRTSLDAGSPDEKELVNYIHLRCVYLLDASTYIDPLWKLQSKPTRAQLIDELNTSLHQLRSIASSPTWKTYVANIAMLAGFIVLASAAGFAVPPTLAAAAAVFVAKKICTGNLLFFPPKRRDVHGYTDNVKAITEQGPTWLEL